MKNLIFCVLAGFSIQVSAQSLENMVSIRTAVFDHPESGQYLEVYTTISGNAIHYERNKKYLYQGGVDVQLVLLQGTEVVNFDKFRLNTPQVIDTNSIDFSLIDQQRMVIPNASLSMEVTVTDILDSLNTFTYTEALLPLDTAGLRFSDVQLLDTFYRSAGESAFLKNGFEMKPYTLNFYPDSRSHLRFYGEVYGTETLLNDPQFLLTFHIESASGNISSQQFFQHAKVQAGPVVSYLRDIDITDLPSGNYNLVVEVHDRQNEVIGKKKIFFQRAKKGAVSAYDNLELISTDGTFVDDYSSEQLSYFLDVIIPRSTADEAKLIASLSPRVEDEMKKKFLYNFWLDRNPDDPYGEWKRYLQLVKEANDAFSTPSRQGYRTDRGRVYLEYGRPYDRVNSVNEPGAYPYEIWFYTVLPDKQTNIGFAFYEPSMVSNDYILLHSNARGELNDPRWKIRIYENVASPQEIFDFDNTDVQDRTNVYRAIDAYDF
ncbi:MAG TPA: GWxTD domain-containing protein [Chitinophagales bacterium]|nr:GWxTD domain-containing protein [Chitinophagales bacterium]